MFLEGYGALILKGAAVTIEVAVLSVLVAFLIGLIGAAGKLSPNPIAKGVATIYTTIIRGIPDLVLMLLLYYSAQIWLNHLTEWQGWSQIDINPFVAAVMTLGFIYGAYFTETLRGAFLSVPKGQLEAAYAYGMTRWQVFHRVLFPQMMRFALPGISNNWQVLVKSAGLVSLLGLNDMVQAAKQAGNATYQQFFFYGVVAFLFLFFTTISNVFLHRLERRYSTGVRAAEL